MSFAPSICFARSLACSTLCAAHQYHELMGVARTHVVTLCTPPCRPLSNLPLPRPPARTCALMTAPFSAIARSERQVDAFNQETDQTAGKRRQPRLRTWLLRSSVLVHHTVVQLSVSRTLRTAQGTHRVEYLYRLVLVNGEETLLSRRCGLRLCSGHVEVAHTCARTRAKEPAFLRVESIWMEKVQSKRVCQLST